MPDSVVGVAFTNAVESSFYGKNITVDCGDGAKIILSYVVASAATMTIKGAAGSSVDFGGAEASKFGGMTTVTINNTSTTGELVVNKAITGAKEIILEGGYVNFFEAEASDFSGKNVIINSDGQVSLHKSIAGAASLTINEGATNVSFGSAVAADFANMTVTFANANTEELVVNKAITGAKEIILEGGHVNFFEAEASDFSGKNVIVNSDGEVHLHKAIAGAASLTINAGATWVDFNDTVSASDIANMAVTFFTDAEGFVASGDFAGAASLTFRSKNMVTISTTDSTLFHENSELIFENTETLKIKSTVKEGAESVKNSVLVGAQTLTFKENGGVTFIGAENVYDKDVTIIADLESWFSGANIAKEYKLASNADFSNATITVTDTKGTEDTKDDVSGTLEDGRWIVDGISYLISADKNGLKISLDPIEIKEITGEDAKAKAQNFAIQTQAVSTAGKTAVLGSSFDADNTVLYANGAWMEVNGLANGKRLYGGSLDEFSENDTTMGGNLTISGTGISVNSIYGGGYLTGAKDVSMGTFGSHVTVTADATFAKDVALLGGSHINNSTGETVIKASSSLNIDAALTNTTFVCGGHGCNTTTEINGSSSLTISAGTYNALVAGGSVLYVSGNGASLTQNGNTTLTITGGAFNENVYGGHIYLYESQEVLNSKPAVTTTVIGTSKVTINCSSGNVSFAKNIFGGSNETCTVDDATVVEFIGSGDGDKLDIGGYVAGGSSGHYGKQSAGEYNDFVTGNSTLRFENFNGALNTGTALDDTAATPGGLYDFNRFTFVNSNVDLGAAKLNSANETWNFSNGSSVTWDAALSFGGDELILGKAGDTIENDWTVFSGLDNNALNFESVKIFGEDAKLTDGCWETEKYKLSVGGTEGDYSLIVSKLA